MRMVRSTEFREPRLGVVDMTLNWPGSGRMGVAAVLQVS